ncbi:MAG TPA: UbiD family decarboxylase [Dehalococcoidia bacterium]|nr:UbiD family decarboxylase [Dehalococcoidia bacterium]
MKLREFMNRLDEEGLLHVVDAEVDWNLEMAAIDAMLGRLEGPAVLFTNVKGYPGAMVFAHQFAGSWERPWRNISFILGLPREATWAELLDELWLRFQSPIKPLIVSTGPCKENKAFGKDVNLFQFPWPYMHQGDGGRYISFSQAITKSLHIDWTNWGTYRHQVQTKNKMSSQIAAGQHIGYMYFQEYEKNNLPMPACIVVGGPVDALLVSCTKIPFGASEVDWVGALAREPVEMVKAETSDLLVPADAEIVIEGEYRPQERMDEGPFGEYYGYMHGPRMPRPVFRAHCITWRNDPILLTHLAEGLPGAGSMFGLGRVVMAYQFAVMMKNLGVYARHVSAKNGFLSAVRIAPGISPEFLVRVAESRPLYQWYNAFMIAGADVNLDDSDDVIEALFCKTHPNRFDCSDGDLPKTSTSVYQTPEERKKGYSHKYWVDATWPSHWPAEKIPQKVTFENSFPQEVQRWVAQGWQRLGLPGEPRLKG